MKRQIRPGVFETNSSSTHAICITKKRVDKDEFPNQIEFNHNEFGWEFKVYEDIVSKASYLYQAICDLYQYNNKKKEMYINQIYSTLGKYGIESSFDKNDNGYVSNNYCNNLKEFVNAVMHSEKRLLRYLFGESKVITGNDNENTFGDYMDQHNFKNYEMYYKSY